MPDEPLFALAAARKLREPGVLREQVEGMLGDPKAKAFTENFTGDWLSRPRTIRYGRLRRSSRDARRS